MTFPRELSFLRSLTNQIRRLPGARKTGKSESSDNTKAHRDRNVALPERRSNSSKTPESDVNSGPGRDPGVTAAVDHSDSAVIPLKTRMTTEEEVHNLAVAASSSDLSLNERKSVRSTDEALFRYNVYGKGTALSRLTRSDAPEINSIDLIV
ncbi:MAG: hypothetical protein K8S56_09325 [Candidatus Cloacimonetes bacterium]|nr:hypothetical protein [Candidatus Cloacimonadota bacterium]